MSHDTGSHDMGIMPHREEAGSALTQYRYLHTIVRRHIIQFRRWVIKTVYSVTQEIPIILDYHGQPVLPSGSILDYTIWGADHYQCRAGHCHSWADKAVLVCTWTHASKIRERGREIRQCWYHLHSLVPFLICTCGWATYSTYLIIMVTSWKKESC